jgi:hypothetical protein
LITTSGYFALILLKVSATEVRKELSSISRCPVKLIFFEGGGGVSPPVSVFRHQVVAHPVKDYLVSNRLSQGCSKRVWNGRKPQFYRNLSSIQASFKNENLVDQPQSYHANPPKRS